MPGFNPKTLINKVRDGNAVVVMVGDSVIGFGQTTTQSIDFGGEQFYGIGSAMPQENQQLKISPEITLSTLQLTDYGLKEVGQSQTWLQVLANTQMDFHIVDAQGNPLLTYSQCTARNYSSTVPANQPITEDTSFMALDVLDGNGNSVLANNSAVVFSGTSAGAVFTSSTG